MEITEILKFPQYALTTDTFSQYGVNFEECIPVCVPSTTGGVCAWVGVGPGGGVCPGGVCLGGCLPRGVSAQGVCGQTDTCNKECFSALCPASVTHGFCCVWNGWMLIG